MQKVKIYFENCFGIKRFKETLNFQEHKCVLIYAPNGTMKTSFAETLRMIGAEKSNQIKDRMNPSKPVVCELKDETGADIAAKNIFVANAEEDIKSESRFSSFLADEALKQRYENIYELLEARQDDFMTKLKAQSQSDDCEKEFIGVFSPNKNMPSSFLECLYSLKNDFDDNPPVFTFKYNNVFDEEEKVKKIIENYREEIVDYFNHYQALLGESSLFSSLDDGKSFGTYQANEIIKATKNGEFFKAQHKLVLKDGIDINNIAQFRALVEEEVNKLTSDTDLKKKFDKITKALDANEKTRLCKQELEKDNSLVARLVNFDQFQRDFWIGCLFALKDDTNALIALYESKMQELTQIISEANSKLGEWHRIVAIYNERFHVPFVVSIENTKDIILKKDTARLKFTYKDKDGSQKDSTKDSLLKILSRGEKRAFHIMQLIFEIEARKREGNDTLVVFDDIADSFDYQNKFAIIEYIKDMNDAGMFKTIALTHNFDFYRTLSSRLGLGNAVFMTSVANDGSIVLKRGQYRKDLFSYLIDGNHNERQLVSIIPFARNLIEYMEGESADYMNLTSCLHIKQGFTDVLTINDIINLVKNKFPQRCQTLQTLNPNPNIKDFIYDVANGIVSDANLDDIMIENKICLSMACRLKAEEYMIQKMSHDHNLMQQINSITSNQARELFEMYRSISNDHIGLIEEVNMMTPEGIHLNSFMYEPLIDMAATHLVDLYNRCKTKLI